MRLGLFSLAFATMVAPAFAQDASTYVGSAQCTECHSDEEQAWKGSHHALAWTQAEPDNIVADFDGTEFTLRGMTARFRIEQDGTHHVAVEELDGKTTDYPIHSVAGIDPLQQYLIETEPGRVQSFDVVWDTEEGRWFHLYPDTDLPPSDALHWTGPYKNWNARCAECHATGFKKNYDFQTKSYSSTQVEIGVGCEACHGPGWTHVAWALETTRTPPPANYGFSVDFSNTEAGIQQCATCHSRREAHLNGNPPPGAPFHDSYTLSLLRPGLYEPNGQILEEVYVYGSFLQSKMYAKGVGCIDCHDGHTAERVAEGNAVCSQCHSLAGNDRFPALTLAEYDSPEHHFHPVGSDGAQCKNCHMVERVYMGNDWRTDHSFQIPRPDLSIETGASNACTTCHTDRDNAWASAQLEEWYPDSTHRGPHYGQVLARGRTNPVASAQALSSLAFDVEEPGIVRATALWLLENSDDPEIANEVVPLLADPDPLVRAASAGALRVGDPQTRVLEVIDLLDDPVRSVRIAAAKSLLDAPIARLPERQRQDMAQAMGDWQSSLSNRLDFPETHLQIAGMALTTRRFPNAIRAFREVVELDPQRVEAWVMQVRIAAAIGQSEEDIRTILREGIDANPGDLTLQSLLSELDEQPLGENLLPPARQSP